MLEWFLGDVVDELGSRREFEYAYKILEGGASADRQLATYARTGDLKAVVDQLVAETAEGVRPAPALHRDPIRDHISLRSSTTAPSGAPPAEGVSGAPWPTGMDTAIPMAASGDDGPNGRPGTIGDGPDLPGDAVSSPSRRP
jgi:carboxylate-amine ligase